MKIGSRDEAREALASAGVTAKTITPEQLQSLRNEINYAMIDSGNYRGTYRMDDEVGLFMTCSTDQWEGREAISFNRDDFIGLAGWADNKNVQPILDAVGRWLDPVIA